MERRAFLGALTAPLIVGGTLSAQTPAPAQAPAKMEGDHSAMMVTVEGCLRPETDVPGRHVPDRLRKPAVADADWVLTDTRMIKGTQPAAEGTKSGPTGTSASSARTARSGTCGAGMARSSNSSTGRASTGSMTSAEALAYVREAEGGNSTIAAQLLKALRHPGVKRRIAATREGRLARDRPRPPRPPGRLAPPRPAPPLHRGADGRAAFAHLRRPHGAWNRRPSTPCPLSWEEPGPSGMEPRRPQESRKPANA